MQQREIPHVSGVPDMRSVPLSHIEGCSDYHDAYNLCVQHGRYRKNAFIAEAIGMAKERFSRCLNGSGNFTDQQIEDLERVCGNWAITQYRNYRRGLPQPPESEKEREIRELEERVRQLKEAG